MDAVIESLISFLKNHIIWEPDRFSNIHNDEMRKAVRAAFREPSNFIPNLLQNGSMEDMETFSKAVKEKAYPMYLATFAGFLEMLYSQEERQLPYSKELVVWFRENGWQFPKFEFEKTNFLTTSSSPTPDSSPLIIPQPQVTVDKIDIE